MSARGRSSDFLALPVRASRSPQRALCRTLTGFPDSPVGPGPAAWSSGHLVPVGRHDSVCAHVAPRPVSRRGASASAPTAGRACRTGCAPASSERRRACSAASGSWPCCRTSAARSRALARRRCARASRPAREVRRTPGRRARVGRPARLRHRLDPGRAARRRGRRDRPGRVVGRPGPGPDGLVGGVGRRRHRGRPGPVRGARATSRPATGCWCSPPTRSTPAEVAGLLVARRYGASRMTVLGDLGATDESRVEGAAATWAADVSPAQRRRARARRPVVGSWTGRAARRRLRARRPAHQARPARLRAGPAGPAARRSCSGTSAPAPARSAIEWMRAHPTCRAIAVEADADRAERIGRNAHRLGVPAPRRASRAARPAALADLPAPGRGLRRRAARPSRACSTPAWRALRPGGRLVVHGVTLETERCWPSATPRTAAS